ncbi:peptide/nickel transport system substrate-binding protein [Rhizobiales bacterium GAS113]|jgi:peptide/nickel transport system substrate-binding protein|nr:peptide/nickel transport system substrate-binding protein [Rhizobiales bacterium GAS113]
MFARLRITLAAGALALAGPAALAATPPDTLVLAQNIDDMITLDPAQAYEFSGVEMISNIYDRIMRFEANDMTKLVGGAAESWTASPDGHGFTFKMRPGMKFHSGNPVTAEDAAFSLQRVIKLDKTPAFLISQLGWTKDNVDTMVKAVDDTTLQITVAEDFAPSFVMSLMSSVVGSVVDKKVVLAHESNGDLGNEWMKANSAGSGPFVLRSWKANESVVLEAFPGYRSGAPTMKRVVVRHVPEAAAQRLLVEKGDADIARDLTPDQVAGLAGNKDVTIMNVPRAALHYLALNLKTPALANAKVRQALRYLVDYQGMTNTFLKGQAKIHQAFWPSGFWASLDDTPYTFDPAKAKQLLAEAGYPNGLELTLDAANTSPDVNTAQAIQSTMAQGGVKLTVLPGEQKAVITKYRARQHQALLLYWGPDYMDPHSNADSFARNTDNSDNAKLKPLAWRNSWDIPELTKQTDAAVRERDSEKRAEMYQDLQRKVMETGPFIIMFQDAKQVAMRANVKNFVMGPTSDLVFYRLVTK